MQMNISSISEQPIPLPFMMNLSLLLMMELISLKNQLKPGPMAIKDAQLFHLACYDIDRFRTAIFEKGLLGDALLPDVLLDDLRTDDGVLLRFGLQWVYEKLFGPQ